MALRQPAQQRARVRSQPFSFPAPTRGWVANGNLAVPQPGGAVVMENWFPTATGAIMRRGKQIYATLGSGDLDTTALFAYNDGNNRKLFGATETTVYDITTIISPINYTLGTEDGDEIVTDDGDFIGQLSTGDLEVITGQTGGNWISVQFSTSGGAYLVNVNGMDPMQVYDGANWYPISASAVSTLNYDAETVAFTVGETLTGGTSGATAPILRVDDNGTTGTLILGAITGGPFQNNETITDGDGGSATADGASSTLFGAFTGVSTSSLSYVWSFKNRLFFIEKETMDAWYLPVDQITGVAVKFPLGGEFSLGGSLVFGASWSRDTGDGLNAMCAFFTSEGEVAIYQGTNPADAAAWSQVGIYRIGKTLGQLAHITAGGDLVIATDIGFVPLSQALQKDYAALSPSAVSAPIEVEWNSAVQLRSSEPWQCEVWSAGQMVIVALPTVNDQPDRMFVANARTGAWAPFTNWGATCLQVFEDRLFCGTTEGRVFELNVTGLDDGLPYTATYLPSFDPIGTLGLKSVSMARAVLKASTALNERLSIQKDYNVSLPNVPDASPVSVSGTWGSGVWGDSVWGRPTEKSVFQRWRSVGGAGETIAPALQITSGSLVAIDAEIIRTDVLYDSGGFVT
jgi:hypothetical protein